MMNDGDEQTPRRSTRNVKKRFDYNQEELDREEERLANKAKEASEERKNETEVLSKIESIIGGRYRPVGEVRRVNEHEHDDSYSSASITLLLLRITIIICRERRMDKKSQSY